MNTSKSEIVQLTYDEKRVSWRHLLVIPQMRRIFNQEKLYELAYNIAANGMVTAQLVAILPEREFWKYVECVCEVWKREIASVDRKKLKQQKRKNHYHVIVAGERRLRALKILWDEGCLVCREANGGNKVTHGKCFLKHLGTELVAVRVPRTKDHRKLLGNQLAENIQDRPTAHEEAEAVAMYTTFLRSENPKISYANVAKRIGRTADLVSRSMAFYALPESIRVLVREKRIKYGVALELARLKDKASYNEEQLLCEANMSVTHKQYAKVGEFHKHVSGLILEYERGKIAGNNELQMMFTQATPENRMKQALNPQVILLTRTLTTFFNKTVGLWEHPKNLPFVEGKKLTLGGLLTDYEKVITTLQLIIPYVEDAVSVEEARQIREGVKKLVQIVNRKKKFHKNK